MIFFKKSVWNMEAARIIKRTVQKIRLAERYLPLALLTMHVLLVRIKSQYATYFETGCCSGLHTYSDLFISPISLNNIFRLRYREGFYAS